MKKPITHSLVNRNLFLVLILIMFSSTAKSQWTFTFQLTQSGPCPAGVPIPVIPTLPNLGLPNQALCESLRQQILAIRSSVPITDSRGNYIGDCTLYYTCTACTGSDLAFPGQGNGQGVAGEVSINGLMEGKSIFTSHQSTAFEDWATEYKQLLASYGITSVMDKKFNIPKTPLTEDKYFNAQYTTLSANFNPKVASAEDASLQDASVVDLTHTSGTVQLLTTEKEQAARDKWYEDHVKDQGYTDLGAIPEEGITRNTTERSTADAAIRTAMGEADGLAGVYGNWAPNFIDEVMGGLEKVVKQTASGNDAQALQTADNLAVNSLVNASKKTAFDMIADKVNGIAFAKPLKAVPRAELVHKVANVGVSFWGNKYPDKDE